MSGTDLSTQERFFPNDWQFSVVINPHRQIWRAFVGHRAPECEGIVIADSSFKSWKRREEAQINPASEHTAPKFEETSISERVEVNTTPEDVTIPGVVEWDVTPQNPDVNLEDASIPEALPTQEEPSEILNTPSNPSNDD